MSAVFEPGSTSTDVVRCYQRTLKFTKTNHKNRSRTALALDLDQDREISGGLAVPGLEGLKKLETVACGADSDGNSSTVFWGRLECVLTGVVSTGRKLIARGVRELEGLAISTGEAVGDGVKGEVTSKGHCSHDIGRGNESVRSRISIIATSEIAVVRSDDWVELEQFRDNREATYSS